MQSSKSMTAALLLSASLLGCSKTTGPTANAASPVIVVGENQKDTAAKDKLAPVATNPAEKNPQAERKKALEEAAEFGLIGLLGPDSGALAELSGPVGIIGGPSGLSMGAGGLGLQGVGTGSGGFGSGGSFGGGGLGILGHSASSYRYGERPKARIEAAQTQGPLPQEVVQRILASHRDDFQDCYELEAADGNTPRGKITLAFTINPEGKVIEARTPEATTTAPNLKACLAQTLGAIDFPQHKSVENISVIVNVSF